MKLINVEEACDYIESSTVEKTTELGHCVVHHGVNAFGARFTMMLDYHGNAVVTEAL